MTAVGATSHRRAPAPGVLASIALFAGAAALAMLMSPSVSLWTDEAVTLSAATRTPEQLWALLQRIDAVHGVYYAFMSGWIHVFGDSPFAVRLPSALAAGATALGILSLTRLIASGTTAWLAAVACATLPRVAWGGIEARPFIFSALAATWATYLLVRAVRSSAPRAWAAYGLVAAAGVLINIYVVLVIVAHAATVLLLPRTRRTLAGFAVAAALAVAVTTPLLLLARSQQGQLGGLGDRNPLSIARKVLVNQLFLGETPTAEAAPAWFTRAWQIGAVAAAAIGLFLITLAVLRRTAPGDRKREILAVAMPWLIIPTVIVAGYAVAVAPLYQPRYLTLVAPAGAILIAVGVRTIRARAAAIALVAVYVVAIAIVFTSQRIPFAKSGSDWSAAARVVESQADAGDAMYFAPRDTDGPSGTAHLTSRRIAYAYPGAFVGLTDLTLQETGAQSATLDGSSRGLDEALPLPDGTQRVWALYSKKGPPLVRTGSDTLLRDAGYVGTVVWDGPSTVVVEYTAAE
ncbi:glycosyltransferase family 39 protein [Microbacterium flavum]|uniref:Glycosyltransferase family 39 protein n=1 Tax=Microbacterium flavum TaxID=415216 RepID=A0ABS5XUX1_9MICO|nr:glycosyltransferase family 39 protein [Microbacterium flavum]MBT8798334.1 glycosyltransferase family 39 protein [Microbacterium flavum]